MTRARVPASGRRPRRRRWENRAGRWGNLRIATLATALAVALTAGAHALAGDARDGWSALLGGAVVLALSALTGLTTAVAWDRAREAVMPLAMGMFVLKLGACALLLGVVPRPAWVVPEAAAVGALVGVIAWQVAEVLLFARTRRGIYAD